MKAADDIFNGKEYAQLGTLFTHHMIFKDKGPFIKYVMQEGEGIYQSVRVKVQICKVGRGSKRSQLHDIT